MKNKFLLLFVSLAMLSACAKTPVAQVGDTKAPETGQKMVQNESSSNKGMKKMDCDDLMDETMRTQCASQVDEVINNQMLREIMHTYDMGRCEAVSGYMMDQCKSFIENSGIKGPLSATEAKALEEALRPEKSEEVDEAGNPIPSFDESPVYNPANCASLSDSNGVKAYCEKQIARSIESVKISEIVRTGKVAGCDALSEDSKQQCRMSMGVMDMPEPPMPN